MTQRNYTDATSAELTDVFVASSIAQSDAMPFDTATFNRHSDRIRAARTELWRRGPAVFAKLLPLLEHPNVMVRLNAASNCLRISPKRALPVLEAVANGPRTNARLQAADALDRWHRGEFPPPNERLYEQNLPKEV